MTTMHSKLRVVVTGMLAAALLSSLFGCGEKYAVEDIIGVSLFESGMDRNASYSYGIVREDDSWYLSAECGNVGRHEYFDCMYLPVNADDLLGIIEDSGYIKKTRAKKSSGIFAPDAPNRSLMLTFSDGTKQSAAIAAPDIRNAFAELAAALEADIPMYSKNETTGIYLSANCMNADNTYSFELFIDDGWHFSSDCLIDGLRVTLDDVRISDEDAHELIDTAFAEKLDMKVFTYREIPDALVLQDEDVFLVSVHFGKTSGQARIRSEKLEDRFFELAKKYDDNDFVKEE